MLVMIDQRNELRGQIRYSVMPCCAYLKLMPHPVVLNGLPRLEALVQKNRRHDPEHLLLVRFELRHDGR